MPRVNRDLQRRMAARRERERRRPGERRYRFAATQPEDALLGQDGEVEELEEAEEAAPTRQKVGAATPVAASTRGGVRAAPRPFSAYRDEYAYVYTDLRRVGAVIGGLLVALIVLYFVLPVLVH